jgi:hypothetical protein
MKTLILSNLFSFDILSYADVVMSLVVIAEKPERDIMSRPPSIRGKDHLLNIKTPYSCLFICRKS